MLKREKNNGLQNAKGQLLCWLNSVVQLLYRTQLPFLLQGTHTSLSTSHTIAFNLYRNKS